MKIGVAPLCGGYGIKNSRQTCPKQRRNYYVNGKCTRIFKALAEDEELKKKLQAASVPTVQDAAAEALVQTAKEAGYDFTSEELQAAFATPAPQNEDGEFSEDELETVARGFGTKTIPHDAMEWLLYLLNEGRIL